MRHRFQPKSFLPFRSSLRRCYILSCAAILAITAVLKLSAALGDSRSLASIDPLAHWLTTRQVLFASAVVELCVVYLLIEYRNATFTSFVLLGCLTGLFALYRIGLSSLQPQTTCNCLGNLEELLALRMPMGNTLSFYLLAYLGVPPLLGLAWRKARKPGRRPATASLVIPQELKVATHREVPLGSTRVQPESWRDALLALTTFFCCSTSSADSTGHSIVVHGRVSCEYYHTDPARLGTLIAAASGVHEFTACLDLPSWNIRVERSNEPDVQYHEAGAETTNEVYYVMVYGSDVVRRNQAELDKLRAHSTNIIDQQHSDIEVATGRIGSGGYPFVAGDLVLRFVWFALASGYHLDTCPADRCQPFFSPVSAPEYLAEAFVERLKGSRLPGRAVFMSDGVIEQSRYFPKVRRFSSPYDHGFTNAIYVVVQATNAGGMVLPRECELNIYRGSSNGRTASDLVTVSHYALHVTGILPLNSNQSWLPKLPGLTLVSDERFRHNEGHGVSQVLYTNTGWPTAETVMASEEFARVKAVTAALRRPKEPSAWVRASLVVLLLMLPLTLILRAKRKGKT